MYINNAECSEMLNKWYDGFDVSALKITKEEWACINLLKATGYVMYNQFNIQQLYALPTPDLCVCICLRTNSTLCHLQYKQIGFYNRDEKCLQRGTDWVFK